MINQYVVIRKNLKKYLSPKERKSLFIGMDKDSRFILADLLLYVG